MRKVQLIVLTAMLLGVNSAFASKAVQVTVNTSSLAGTTGSIDFQFNPGPLVTQASSLQISGFSGATYVSGTQQLTGGATGGPIPTALTLTNATVFNDAFEDVRFGSSLLFTLVFSGPAVDSPNGLATSTSQFAFSIFSDAAGTVPALTSDPNGIAGTVTVKLDGTLGNQAVSPQLAFSAVPEPSSWLLFAGSGLLIIGGLFRRRR